MAQKFQKKWGSLENPGLPGKVEVTGPDSYRDEPVTFPQACGTLRIF